MDYHFIARADSSSGKPPTYKAIGISLAVASGLFIGISFVLKKIGLLKANVKYNEEAGEGYGYLRNVWWWTGMTLMIVGEICNFVAYAFVDAILVTPLGALAVVVTTILSAIFLKERLSFVGKVGCFSCIIGSVVIPLNAPEQSSVSDIQEMKAYVITPGFLSYAGVIVVGCAVTAIWAGPRYGKRNMFVYIMICSLIGGLSVVATQGLGSAIIAQVHGKEQFKEWFLYVLLVFVVATLLTEIVYLNKALNIFNAALVTPTYYVFFTSATIITSAVLFQGFQGSGKQIATVVMGFLQICCGVILLQLSKSSKDVPDAAVFKGDLDQIREVATQEESETEPKADSIRGAAAIVRRLSTPRKRAEDEDARRYLREREEEKLRPASEGEVEWDGLRRRTGSIRSRTPSTKSSLPPLGMSRFPDEEQQEDRGHSFLEGIRSRILHPLHWLPIHHDDHNHGHDHNEKTDTAYHGPEIRPATGHTRSETPKSITWADQALPSPTTSPVPAPTPAQHKPRRDFSFNSILHRLKPSISPSPRSLSKNLTLTPNPEKQALKTATEEEQLGLVLGGDSHKPEDDELNARLARSNSCSSRDSDSESSLGDGQALMERLHRSLDEAQMDYRQQRGQRDISGSTTHSHQSEPHGEEREEHHIYPLSLPSSQPPSYTSLPHPHAHLQQGYAQRPPTRPVNPLASLSLDDRSLVGMGMGNTPDSQVRVALHQSHSFGYGVGTDGGGDVRGKGSASRGGWRREEY